MKGFLGAFEKLRKATVRIVMSVRPSVCASPVRMEQIGSHWMDFNEIWYCSVFRKPVDKLGKLYIVKHNCVT